MSKLKMSFFNKYIAQEKITGEERVHVYGAIYQRPRLAEALIQAFERGPGDAIEIGCMAGGTSVFLAEVCQKYGRTLVCVDPWEDFLEWIDYSAFYEEFIANIEPFKDCVQVIRKFSQDPEAITLIQKHKYAFAFVDGDHNYKPVLTDLRTILPVTKYIVASDDHRYNPGVQQANREASIQFPDWEFKEFDDFREAWFLK